MSNTEQKQKILLKRTTEVNKPSIPSGASHGELFLNIASGANAHNKISTMQIGTNNPIIWSDDVANEKKFALKTEVEALVKEVEDSEFVTANALTQINKSAGFTEGGISKLPDQQSLTDAIIELQNKTQDLEESDPIFTDSPAAGITDDDIKNWDNKLDKDGKAASAQTADFATELTGRLEATSEAFTYRPSAGDKSIKDDNAFIRRVKGNSVVFNQMLKNGNFATTTDWSPYQSANVSLNWDNGLTVTSNYAGTGGDQISVRQAIAQPFILGHKYFVHFEFSTSNTSLTPLVECFNALYSNEQKVDYVQSGNHYYSINNVKDTRTTVCYLKAVGTKAVGDTWTFKDVMIIDLTQMFGAGNEPTTVEEFRALYPDSYYPYNAGALRNLVCSGIKTVGFNQWDGATQVGYIDDKTGVVTSNSSYLCTDFIRIIPNQEYYINTEQTNGRWGAWYDANKNYVAGILNYDQVYTAPANAAYVRLTIKTANGGNPDTFCINLHHTGYRDGEYESYKEVTHALPLSQITNGEPLRKAGSVYDEINETEYIRRVGVVDMGTLIWVAEGNNIFVVYQIPNMIVTTTNNSRLDGLFCAKYATDSIPDVGSAMADKTMKRHQGRLYLRDTSFTDVPSFKAALSGVLLQYELAEPIVTPIETPIDFNYYVEDFGTEEAILAENSAPFSADIVYQFNAVDRIRQNDLNIDRLEEAIIELQNKTQDLEESDPIFTDSPAAGITDDDIENWDNKLDKDGKAASAQTADFATELTGRLEATSEAFTYRPSAGDKSIKDDNAFIRRVKGNSVVFNQILVPRNLTETSNGITVTQDGTGKVVVKGTATGRTQVSVGTAQIISGHKYIYFGLVGDGANKFYWTDQTASADTGKGVIAQPTYASGDRYFILNVLQGVTVDFTFYPQVSDLTAMFGAGNEPTTVEEFRALYPDSYYTYNPGELRNLVCSGIKTVGFNQWDEQWEVGGLGTDEYGSPIAFDDMIRSTNYNPIFPSTEYYIRTSNAATYIWYYDSDKKYIGRDIKPNSRFFITPTNAAYFKLRIGDATNTITTYNHDICINLHHTGYRDGEYESYKEVTHALPLSQITNGEPLRKAGSVYDEINETEYIRRVGVVDLGSLGWGVNDASKNTFWAATKITDATVFGYSAQPNLTCRIDVLPFSEISGTKKCVSMHDAQKRIVICAPDFEATEAGASALKTSLSGVLLHYELAEPIVTPIETPIDFNYYVEDFGTEEAILADNSAPFNADIIYQFNAVDRIRQNDLNIDRLEKELLLKQDNIEDLEDIRNNATFGAAAYSWGNHADAGYLSGYTEQYRGTITEIKMNGASKGTSGVVDLGSVLTSTANKVNSASTADNATTSTKAIQDGDGNVIATTYSTKEELSGAVNDIIEEIIDNELVTSTAISTMNASAGFNEDGTSALPNKQSLTDAIVELQNKTQGLNNGSIFAASDRTLKTHIEDIDGSLDKIKKIPKVYFHWNNDEDKKRQMGTYAQDLEEVYPELVTKDKDGIRAVAYDRLGVVALAGIDKLYDMVQELMKKNDELEKRIKELEENK